MRYEALFLDMDGTFLDFHAAERAAFLQCMARFGVEGAEEAYPVYSALNDGFWKAFERGEISRQQIREQRFGALFLQLGVREDGRLAELEYERLLREGHELLPHARQVLTYLAARYPLYVVTNGFADTQRRRLALAGIDSLMTKLFISEQIGAQKPEKAFFDHCFAHLERRTAPENILLIGDSLTSDIRGAANAGMPSCWFNPERRENNSGLEPDYEIASLTELMSFL